MSLDVYLIAMRPVGVFEGNITHNLGEMADHAGIYQHLWRPEEVAVTKASELIEPLRAGLVRLENEPDRFKAYNPENGWGTYDRLVLFVREYLAACEEYPDAIIQVSR